MCEIARSYLDTDEVGDIRRAYVFGAEAHDGQHRASGEPYINHPLQVARILAQMRLDYQVIIAAILHDVIEDTEMAKEQVADQFGEDVAELVDGVSKLTQIRFSTKAEANAEYFRKMLMAMARDIRVMLIKLADRLHNMRTLNALRAEKRRQIARETLDIYAPIANRLGVNSIRHELEDLGFRALYPQRYRVLSEEVRRARGHRKQVLDNITRAIGRRMTDDGLNGEVKGREKNLYSLYRKMASKGLSFLEVMDIYAFRIVVETADLCYRVLGSVHSLYKPVPFRFKDYIAIPKANGYQSLHTVLAGPFGVPIEVQIRTREMHAVAEAGVAAHWRYKMGEAHTNTASTRAREWVQDLLEMQQTAGDSLEFIEHVKVDLFPDEVYVFTPAGEIFRLPAGATPVDFAYAVHTDVGNTCIAVKIDRRYAPLSAQLSSGQTIEVVTAPWAKPSGNWLNFVVTGKARANIRNQLKSLRQGEATELGERLLSQALAAESKGLNELDEVGMTKVLEELAIPSYSALLEEIGWGRQLAPLVVRRMYPVKAEAVADEEARLEPGAPRTAKQPLFIRGTDGMLVVLGKCCHPIPGDPIVSFVSRGRGIVVHRRGCNNMNEHTGEPYKWLDVQWEAELDSDFPVEIRVHVENRKGILATVAATISKEETNIENVQITDRDGLITTLTFLIDVRGRKHLADVMRKLRNIPLLTRLERARN
ncbi:MAG: RelA/SpoT family protein [Gammaproteobacteria bacterium]|nr:RelA/SpoT family protein [Gammaproteobacteria bacterium]